MVLVTTGGSAPGTEPEGQGERPLVLTARGRRVLLVLALVVVALLALAIRSTVVGSAPPVAAAGSSAAPTATRPASPATTPQATPSPSVSSTAGGVPRSGLVGTGTFTTSTVALPAATRTTTLHTFVVKVEGGVQADADEVARHIHATLNDARGWTGYRGASFAAVSDEAEADLVVHLASPPTTTRMCAPLRVRGRWSCASSTRVVLNSDRWLLLTPTYEDAAEYRAYMVNHEVGHYLGRGHVGCPRTGAPAPVMLQQSIRLGGCTPNAWPRTSTEAG